MLREWDGTKYAYLVFSACMAYIAHRGMARGYRDSMLSFIMSLVPSELSHNFIGLNAFILWQVYHKWIKSRHISSSLPHRRAILDTWVGALGACLQGYALFKLAAIYHKNISAKHIIRKCLIADSDIPLEDIRIGELTWKQWIGVLLPLPQPIALKLSHPGIAKVKTLTYAYVGRINTRPLYMDVYRQTQGTIRMNAPILVYIHGGGWIMGTRKLPPLPLVYHVASMGWIVCSIDYRLIPKVQFPDQLIDCKRAIAYLRQHAETELNADPQFIVVAGESAGAHLASLVALTPTDKSLQPGFEDVDTSVRACIDTYGVHDVLDRHGIYYSVDLHDGFLRYVELFLVQRRWSEGNEEIFHKASPVSWLTKDHLRTSRIDQEVPPFMMCHGSHDSLVLSDDSLLFYELLKRYRSRCGHEGDVKDVYLELPGAHHSFNFLLSPRSIAHAQAVGLFLDNLYKKTKHVPIGGNTVSVEEPTRLEVNETSRL